MYQPASAVYIELSLTGMHVNIAGDEYSFTRGSDLARDGMFIEAELIGAPSRRTVAEVFYSDEKSQFFVSCFEEGVPVELIEFLIAEGRRLLPPMDKNER
jgi:hypothetical protein